MRLLRSFRSVWSGGRVLGGSSATNAMMYVRGHPADYDGWAADGWGYRQVLPFFRRAETFLAPPGRADPAHRGSRGPMRVMAPPHAHPMTTAFVDAAREAGLSSGADMNGEAMGREGFSYAQVTQNRGWR